MLIEIGWRNIWRNRGRSLTVIGAIAIGIWSVIFTYGFSNSFLDGYIRSQVNFETSHIQIHHPEFKKDYETRFVIPRGSQILRELKKSGKFKAISHRSVCNGMISSPRKASGISIRGIDPAEEAGLIGIDTFITEGEYFPAHKKNQIVIGYKLAMKLQVKLRSKVVLTFQDRNGQIVSSAYRVCGILKTHSPTYNETTAMVEIHALNKLLDIGNSFHEIAMMAQEGVEELAVRDLLSARYKDDLVESWKDLAPELEYFLQSTSNVMLILQVIIMIALIFGIINTMLMSVLERIKELGMLMAVGMNKKRVFSMIMLETIFLAAVGSPIGLLISYLTMHWLGNSGIDLSAYSKGLEMYGYDNVLYPSVEASSYIQVIFGIFITSVIGAVYPAFKAIRLKPVEALHKI